MSVEIDTVSMLLFRLGLARRNESVSDADFMELVQRLVRTSINEHQANAIEALRERQDAELERDLRATLSERFIVVHEKALRIVDACVHCDAPFIVGLEHVCATLERNRCPYCTEYVTGSLFGHYCDRKHELGFDRDDAPSCESAQASSSTGAAVAESEAEHTSDKPAATGPVAPTQSSHSPPSDHGSPGAALSRDSECNTSAETPRARASTARRMTLGEIASLRASFDEVMLEHEGLPRGWVSRQAERMGFTFQAVNDRVRPWIAARSNGSGQSEPEKREHANSSACWCRKGVNNAANRWCSNAPSTAQHVTLADPRATMQRPGRGERPRN